MRAIALAVLVVGACGAESPATADHTALHEAVLATAAELNVHWAQIMRAGDMDAVRVEAERHRSAMASVLDRVRAGLEACAAGRMMLEVDDIERGYEATPPAADLASAQAAADGYVRAMSAALHPMLQLGCGGP
jgi:hypothetical protein